MALAPDSAKTTCSGRVCQVKHCRRDVVKEKFPRLTNQRSSRSALVRLHDKGRWTNPLPREQCRIGSGGPAIESAAQSNSLVVTAQGIGSCGSRCQQYWLTGPLNHWLPHIRNVVCNSLIRLLISNKPILTISAPCS